MHRQNEHITAVNLPVDRLLRPPLRRGPGVLAAERLDVDEQRRAEAGIGFLQHLLERRPLPTANPPARQ